MTYEQRRAGLKSRLVSAHRAQDWELARRLSPAWEKLKRRPRCAWPGCGVALSGTRRDSLKHHCRTHDQASRRLQRLRRLGLLGSLLLLTGCATTPTPLQAGRDIWPTTYTVGPYFGPGFKPYWGIALSGAIPPYLNPFMWFK